MLNPKDIVSKILRMVLNTKQFIQRDIWRIRDDSLPPFRAFALKLFKIVLIAIRIFGQNQPDLRASALTFFTILSIVPAAAMAFGIAKGFGFEKILETQLLSNFPGQEEIIEKVIGFADNLLKNTRGELIAGVGLAVLFWTVAKVLGHIENALNALWDINIARTIGRKLSDYLSVMIIAPMIVVISGSVTVFIQTQVNMITGKIGFLSMFGNVISFGFKLIPFGLIWVLFSLIYILMPNRKVSVVSGIIAGVIGGTIYQFTQWAYIHFQVGVASYNAIYGSFAALPLFLIWIQLSWLIVLFGAAISAAHQNAAQYEFAAEYRSFSLKLKRLLCLNVMYLIVRQFASAEPPMTEKDIAKHLDIPMNLTRIILSELSNSRLISMIFDKIPAYQPARDIQHLSISRVIEELDRQGNDDISIPRNPISETLSRILEEFGKAVETCPANVQIRDVSLFEPEK